jgi:hypothetical protein
MDSTAPACIIHDYRHSYLQSIAVKRPVTLGSKMCFFLEHQTHRKRYLIQTPTLCLPYRTLSDDRGNISMDLSEMYETQRTHDFFVFLQAIHDKILRTVNYHYPTLLQDKKFISPIKEKDDVYMRRLKLRGIHTDEVTTFDVHCKPVPFNTIHREEPIQCIISLQYLWCYENVYGIKYKLLQVKHYLPNLQQCLVVSSEADAAPPAEIAQLFEKYTRMRRAGVLQEALRQKMAMDQLPTFWIGAFFATPSSSSPPPPPPVPSLPTKSLPIATETRSALLQQITMGVKLRKPSAATSSKSTVLASPPPSHAVFRPPSLQEILATKGSLRKTKKILE